MEFSPFWLGTIRLMLSNLRILFIVDILSSKRAAAIDRNKIYIFGLFFPSKIEDLDIFE